VHAPTSRPLSCLRIAHTCIHTYIQQPSRPWLRRSRRAPPSSCPRRRTQATTTLTLEAMRRRRSRPRWRGAAAAVGQSKGAYTSTSLSSSIPCLIHFRSAITYLMPIHTHKHTASASSACASSCWGNGAGGRAPRCPLCPRPKGRRRPRPCPPTPCGACWPRRRWRERWRSWTCCRPASSRGKLRWVGGCTCVWGYIHVRVFASVDVWVWGVAYGINTTTPRS
jgi:hypothetical protein